MSIREDNINKQCKHTISAVFSYLIFRSGALIVGEFDDFEMNLLLHPECSSVGRVRMNILPVDLLLLSSTNWHPLGLKKLVTSVVGWQHFHL